MKALVCADSGTLNTKVVSPVSANFSMEPTQKIVLESVSSLTEFEICCYKHWGVRHKPLHHPVDMDGTGHEKGV